MNDMGGGEGGRNGSSIKVNMNKKHQERDVVWEEERNGVSGIPEEE